MLANSKILAILMSILNISGSNSSYIAEIALKQSTICGTKKPTNNQTKLKKNWNEIERKGPKWDKNKQSKLGKAQHLFISLKCALSNLLIKSIKKEIQTEKGFPKGWIISIPEFVTQLKGLISLGASFEHSYFE
jgi:hypothetical protein